MERLNLHLIAELARSSPIDVVGPRGCDAMLGEASRVVTCALKPLWRFLVEAFVQTARLAKSSRPSHVIAGSGLCAPIAWFASRMVGARAAVYIHGLDIVTDNAVYRRLWMPFVRRCDVCIANSANTAQLAREAGVPPERIYVVHPGATIPVVAPDADSVTAFRSMRGWEGRRVLLSVGRLTERKGVLDFVRDVLPALVKDEPTLLFAVVGNDAPNALRQRRSDIRASIMEAAAAAGLLEHVALYGELPDADLDCAYAASDVSIFPVKTIPGDVEGFGMVAIEAAAHGLPTVAYAVGGVPDAISDGVSGRLVAAGDSEAFAQAVKDVLKCGRAHFAEGSRQFAQRFAWTHFGDGVRRAMDLPDVG
jgi:phosphatidylinositol alpha-1,6-mannosyltransferase